MEMLHEDASCILIARPHAFYASGHIQHRFVHAQIGEHPSLFQATASSRQGYKIPPTHQQHTLF
jgi:hypothetical protein